MAARPRFDAPPERMEAWARSHWWLLDLMLAVALGIIVGRPSVNMLLDAPPTGWRAALIAGIVVSHAALALRRRWPRTTFAVTALVALLLTLAPDVTAVASSAATASNYPPILLPSGMVVLFGLYAVAAYGRRPGPQLGLVIAAIGALLVTWRLASWGVANATLQLTEGWQVALTGAVMLTVVTGVWSLGLLRRLRAAYVVALEDRARRAEADREERAMMAVREERARIAREMHDIVAHSLAVIVRQAEAGRFAARSDPGAAEQMLTAIGHTGREALTDMRTLLGVLREGREGDPIGPQPTLADLPDLIQRLRDSGLSVAFEERGTAMPLQRAADLAVFRLVQEALTNVVKHAGPGATASVLLQWDRQGLTVEVADTGSAPDPDAAAGTGHGLVGMRERLRLVGGDLSARPRLGGGFLVSGRVPSRTPSNEGHPR